MNDSASAVVGRVMVASVAESHEEHYVSNPDHIDFFWRPGCPFCMRLERGLADAGVPFAKLNIWEDDQHAEFVRSVADGNETVPTLRIGSASLVNPSVNEVIDTMRRETPDLVPSGS